MNKRQNYHAIPLLHLTSTYHMNFHRQSTSEDVQLNSFKLHERRQYWKIYSFKIIKCVDNGSLIITLDTGLQEFHTSCTFQLNPYPIPVHPLQQLFVPKLFPWSRNQPVASILFSRGNQIAERNKKMNINRIETGFLQTSNSTNHQFGKLVTYLIPAQCSPYLLVLSPRRFQMCTVNKK